MKDLLKYMDWEIDEEGILWIIVKDKEAVNKFKEIIDNEIT